MAEMSDVRLAICTVISAALYPNGTGQASALSGFSGGIAIIPDWPMPKEVSARTDRGDIVIAVTQFDFGRSTKRFPVANRRISTAAPTMAWCVAENVATLTGTVTPPQNLALVINGQFALVHPLATGDTIASILADFASQAATNGFSDVAVSDGAITIPGAHELVARVGTYSTMVKPTGQQLARFRVSCWAPSEVARAAAVKCFKPVLDDTRRMLLSDGTMGQISSGTAMEVDDPDKLGIKRTDCLFPVEWSTTITIQAPQVIVFATTMQSTVAAAATTKQT